MEKKETIHGGWKMETTAEEKETVEKKTLDGKWRHDKFESEAGGLSLL